MQIKVHTQKGRHVSTWAGGTTAELWIWPQDADYASRNFQARISSATVCLPESDFTALPGVIRYITPLSEKFVLSHPDGRKVAMSPLDAPYRFDGGVATHCSGTATDFNLMLKGVEGSMTILRGRQTVDDAEFCCVYSVGGENITVNGNPLNINAGDLAVIHLEDGEKAVIEAAEAIICKILI